MRGMEILPLKVIFIRSIYWCKNKSGSRICCHRKCETWSLCLVSLCTWRQMKYDTNISNQHVLMCCHDSLHLIPFNSWRTSFPPILSIQSAGSRTFHSMSQHNSYITVCQSYICMAWCTSFSSSFVAALITRLVWRPLRWQQRWTIHIKIKCILRVQQEMSRQGWQRKLNPFNPGLKSVPSTLFMSLFLCWLF